MSAEDDAGDRVSAPDDGGGLPRDGAGRPALR